MQIELATKQNLMDVLTEEMDQVGITDIHTHIYPAEFEQLSLWGIDELLTYHYLVAEYFRFSNMDYDAFFALPKATQAALIWEKLFTQNSPVSEAARGVLTVLNKLGLDVSTKDLNVFRKYFQSMSHGEYISKVFEIAGVREVVMTNDPFDNTEREFWATVGNKDERFKAVLRLDPLINEYEKTAVRLTEWGYDTDKELNPKSISAVQQFLKDWTIKIDALYMAVSLPPDFAYPEESTRGKIISECILPLCKELNIPFALMVGAKPAVNPNLRVAGYGIGKANVTAIENLCREWPENKFLVTMLSKENQHELCVLARKFKNVMLFGCWWFLNNPVIIEEMTRMRIETLGFSFIPQHSDARVIDQLIYKWSHSKIILKKVLYDKYADLLDSGWQITRNEIKRDMEVLFGKAFWNFIGR